jgi:hypothetical protein
MFDPPIVIGVEAPFNNRQKDIEGNKKPPRVDTRRDRFHAANVSLPPRIPRGSIPSNIQAGLLTYASTPA